MRQIGRERGEDREVRELGEIQRERQRQRERCTHMYIIIGYLPSVSISIIKKLNTKLVILIILNSKAE